MANEKRSGLYVQLPTPLVNKVRSECNRLKITQWEFVAHALRTAPTLTRGTGPSRNILVSGLDPGNRSLLRG